MNNNNFLLSTWGIIGTFLLAIIALGIYSGYLDDTRDLAYTSQGLQPYQVGHCSGITITTEWHEVGWNKPTETRSITILNTKGN